MQRDRCLPGPQSLTISRRAGRPRRRVPFGVLVGCISYPMDRSPGPCRPALLPAAAISSRRRRRRDDATLLLDGEAHRWLSAAVARRASESVCRHSCSSCAMQMQAKAAIRLRCEHGQIFFRTASVFMPLASFIALGFFGAVELNLAYKLAASICATPLTALCRCRRRAVASRALVLNIQPTTV